MKIVGSRQKKVSSRQYAVGSYQINDRQKTASGSSAGGGYHLFICNLRLQTFGLRAFAFALSLLLAAYCLLPAAYCFQQSQERGELAAADFPKFIDEYLADTYSRHPLLASMSGMHAWESRLEDYSAPALADEAAAIRKFQARLEKIPPLQLSFSELFDYQIIASNMKARLVELEQVKSYTRDPAIYSYPIIAGLLRVEMFEYAPIDSRLRHVIAKQKQIPHLIDAARAGVQAPPPVFSEERHRKF